MERNQDVVRTSFQKADLKIADMSSAGALLPAQAKKIMDIAIQDQVVLKECTFRPLSSSVEEVDRMGFLSRITRGGQEGQSLSESDRSKPTVGAVTFTTVKLKAQVNLTDEDCEQTVEGGTFEAHITRLMGERLGLDLEDLVWNGNTSSTDSLLKLLNGLFVKASSHAVDNGSKVLEQADLMELVGAIPSQFKRNKKAMRIYAASDVELKWRDLMAGRVTGLGDSAILSSDAIPAYGIPVVEAPMIETPLGGGSGESSLLFCDPKNVAVGVWKQVRVRTQQDIDSGNLKIVSDQWVDVEFLYEPAVAKLITIKAA